MGKERTGPGVKYHVTRYYWINPNTNCIEFGDWDKVQMRDDTGNSGTWQETAWAHNVMDQRTFDLVNGAVTAKPFEYVNELVKLDREPNKWICDNNGSGAGYFKDSKFRILV